MPERDRISKRAADNTVAVLEARLVELSAQLKALEKELQAEKLVSIQKEIAAKIAAIQSLEMQIREIKSGIDNIQWAQKNPVQTTGGGCAG